MRVDLNCDLGESFGAYTIGQDENIIPLITSANVACGFHAGDPKVMQQTVLLCKEQGVSVGAHPGYHDLEGFGRRTMQVSPDQIYCDILYQVGALKAFCEAQDVALAHVKPHGALYNQAGKDEALAKAICQAVYDLDPTLKLFGQAHTKMEEAAKAVGLPFVSEVFADRAYLENGSLVPRSEPGAVIHDEAEAITRSIRMVKDGVVETIDGKTIPIRAETICVHGDNTKALQFVEKIRRELLLEGVSLG